MKTLRLWLVAQQISLSESLLIHYLENVSEKMKGNDLAFDYINRL